MPPERVGTLLDGLVRALFQVSWGRAREWIAGGKIRVNGEPVLDSRFCPPVEAEIALVPDAPRPPRAADLPAEAIVHLDAHVVVVDKPAGISTVPFERGERGTLDERLRALLARRQRGAGSGGRPALGVVHRLDKETTGLLVFTRSWLAKQQLSRQFRAHSVHRRYLALAHGRVSSQTIRSVLLADRGDGRRGSTDAAVFGRTARPEEGRPAVTHVEALEPLDGATLIACRLETGRTHQIRIHLAEAGHPLLGERVYTRGYDGPWIPAPRVMLHAQELGFVHPATGEALRWTRPPPPDFCGMLERLRLGLRQ